MEEGKKILIVDDGQEDRALLQEQLTNSGYSITQAGNGREALEKITLDRPDLVVTDVLMPDMDGFVFYKELRKKEETKSIPIVILTVRAKMQDTFLALGAEDFIVKPVNIDDFVCKVRALIGGGVLEQSTDTAETEMTSPEVQPEVAASESEAAPTSESEASSVAAASEPPKVILKKVLICGSSAAVLQKMKDQLEAKQCGVVIAQKGSEILPQYLEFDPDIVIINVLVHGALSHEVIRRLRKQPGAKNKPIIIFSFLDRENLDVSVHQQALNIENGRRLCLEAGANESLGGFQEATFIPGISKYLNE